MRDIAAFHHAAMRALGRAAAAANSAAGPEEALQVITEALPRLLGDRQSHLQPGNLKAGEKQQFACCCFVVTPARESQLLVAPVNFLPEQRHTRIGIDLGHPGHVLKTKRPLLLANTDEHKSFVKILLTFRAGSAVFAPLLWKGDAIGVIVCAAQARYTMTDADLEVHIAFSHLAAAALMAHGGVIHT